MTFVITVGSKVKQVKQLNAIYSNVEVGTIYNVINLTRHGMTLISEDKITIMFITYNEFGNCFVECVKRKWSEWEKDLFTYYDFSGERYNVPVKIRENGKTVQLRTNWENKDNIKVKASCNKTDNFDLDTGIEIADRRMQIKLMERELEKMLDKLD